MTTVPTMSATSFIVAHNIAEILVSAGITIATVERKDGQEQAAYETHWFHTISIPPQAARNLYLALSETLQAYEAQFGAIPKPKDAAATMQ